MNCSHLFSSLTFAMSAAFLYLAVFPCELLEFVHRAQQPARLVQKLVGVDLGHLFFL